MAQRHEGSTKACSISLNALLIISDIRMPEINGIELYMSLKAIKNDAKVLFASAIELAEEILSVMPGVRREQLIRKPVEQKVFIDLVKKTIRESS